MKYLALASLLLFSLIQPTHAQVEQYKFDTVHTQVLFFINHLGFSRSQGEFLEFDGGFEFNRAEPEKSSVNVVIDTNSIDMDDDIWNKKMRGKNFLNTTNYPTMVFESTNIETTSHKAGKITGNLTLLGVTKPVTLDVMFNKAGIHTFNQKYVAGFSAKTSIKRSDFGLTYGRPLIGDTVEIILEIEGFRQNGEIYNQ